MKLTPVSIDPTRLLRPMTVAKRVGVHPSMVTHWMNGNQLDYVEIDEARFVPEESVAVLQAMRSEKSESASA